jgi:hypothetical protein
MRTRQDAVLLAACVALSSNVLLAQKTPPPRQAPSGVNVSDAVYKGAGALAGATVAGVKAVGQAVEDLVTPGNKTVDGLEGLRKKSVVVVHYPPRIAPASLRKPDADDEDLIRVEGVVTRIDRGRKEITVRFDSSTTETFQLIPLDPVTGSATAPTPPDPTAILIDYSDETGQRVERTFRKKA